MRVLYFGTYERNYPRNAQVISCLRGAGVEVVERHVSVWERRRAQVVARARGRRQARLRRGTAPAAEADATRFDALIVGYPGHFDLPAARRIARGQAGDLQSARVAPRDPRRGPAALRRRLGSRPVSCVAIDRHRAPARRPRRRRHGAERATPGRARSAARRTARGLLRRRRGAALPARLAAARRPSTRSSSAS